MTGREKPKQRQLAFDQWVTHLEDCVCRVFSCGGSSPWCECGSGASVGGAAAGKNDCEAPLETRMSVLASGSGAHGLLLSLPQPPP